MVDIFGIRFLVMSGLGNLMFQIATGEWWARHYGMDVIYDKSVHFFNLLTERSHHEKHARDYMHIFPAVDWMKNQYRVMELRNYKQVPFNFVDIKPEHGCIYFGYFQSPKYFDNDFARELFKPSEAIKAELLKYDVSGNSCSIHVRRGDYLDRPDIHTNLTMNYYNSAMEIIQAERYFIFSDDIDWCRENFKGDQFTFIHDINYIEMFLMGLCRHNIIANSSFSWWGAFLGDPSGRVVIAPCRWFGPKALVKADDILPVNWIKI